MEEKRYRLVTVAKGIPKFLENLCGRELLRIHNSIPNNGRDLYSMWNNTFEDLYGSDLWGSRLYETYIRCKMTNWYKKHVKSWLFSSKSFGVTEDFWPQASLRFLPKSKIHIFMEEV